MREYKIFVNSFGNRFQIRVKTVSLFNWIINFLFKKDYHTWGIVYQTVLTNRPIPEFENINEAKEKLRRLKQYEIDNDFSTWKELP